MVQKKTGRWLTPEEKDIVRLATTMKEQGVDVLKFLQLTEELRSQGVDIFHLLTLAGHSLDHGRDSANSLASGLPSVGKASPALLWKIREAEAQVVAAGGLPSEKVPEMLDFLEKRGVDAAEAQKIVDASARGPKIARFYAGLPADDTPAAFKQRVQRIRDAENRGKVCLRRSSPKKRSKK